MSDNLTQCRARKEARRRTVPSGCLYRVAAHGGRGGYVAAAVLIGARNAHRLYRILALPRELTTAVKELAELEDSDARCVVKASPQGAGPGRSHAADVPAAGTRRTIGSSFSPARQKRIATRSTRRAWNNLVLMQGHGLDVLGVIATWPKGLPVQPDPALRKLVCEAHPYGGRLLLESRHHPTARPDSALRGGAEGIRCTARCAPSPSTGAE